MSYVDAVKLLGILNLTEVQKANLRCAYNLQRANGYVNARGRGCASLKASMHRFVKWELATPKRTVQGNIHANTFVLTSLGMQLGEALAPARVKL